MIIRPLLLPVGLLVAWAWLGCAGDARPKVAAPAPRTSESAAVRVAAPSATAVATTKVREPAPPCAHERPFTFDDKTLAMPAPYDAFTPCQALAAIFPDYDREKGSSAAAGGPVRIYSVRRWDTAGRTLLGVVYYVGEDVTESFVCGQCQVSAKLAALEVESDRLRVAAKAKETWRPKNGEALFSGLAELDLAPLAFDAKETLLPMRTDWSTGKPGSWRSLSLYRLEGAELSLVLSEQDQWWASGMGTADDDVVASEVSVEPRSDGPNGLRVKIAERRCHIDTSKDDPPTVCGKDVPLGTQRWRFSGKAYKRIEGKPTPLPKLLHKLWGW
jgi:hypothetical protein